MPRKYYVRRYYGGRDKYSIEQTSGTLTLVEGNPNGAITVVPFANIQGMRKVKHITIQMADRVGATGLTSLTWALVFVPAGTEPSVINKDESQNLYEPNQYVMSCGVFDFNAGPLRISSPLARNLNSGDQIALVVKQNTVPGSATSYDFVVRYAITLQ